jgi:hypothetical protein
MERRAWPAAGRGRQPGRDEAAAELLPLNPEAVRDNLHLTSSNTPGTLNAGCCS